MVSENEYMTWQREKLALKCISNLEKHQFDAHLVPTRESARDLILSMTSDCTTFGLGGSDTVRSLGIPEALVAEGKTLYDHWDQGLTREAEMEIRLQQGRSDCFLCSANAVSVTGEIVNVDGVGNRTNAMCFGAKKVVVIAGVNKLALDLGSALRRVREVAGPLRAKSLGMGTPCVETGICSDCNSPQRICRITTVLHRRPMLTDISIVLVNRTLGY
jgi:hypothetical protein